MTLMHKIMSRKTRLPEV